MKGYGLNDGGLHGLMEVHLTDAGKTGIQEHHPQGIVWEYDPDKPFKLHSMARARAHSMLMAKYLVSIHDKDGFYFKKCGSPVRANQEGNIISIDMRKKK